MGGDNNKTHQQPNAKETEQFWTKIWQPKQHNEKAEWIKHITRELEQIEEGPKAEIHTDLLRTKGIKLENARPSWNTWFLVQEVHLNSRQTSIRNEQMPTNSARTRVDG